MKLVFNRLTVATLSMAATVESQGCPYLQQQLENPQMIIADEYLTRVQSESFDRRLEKEPGDYGVPDGGYQAVMDDLDLLLTDSQDFWPGDFAGTEHGPHYGGLFIRLAWHCSGSYRESDGRGGCDGGRIRFAPELEWPDNGNLDMALKLLEPIKEKYGSKLSWGDLIILSGTVAIKSMGGPFLGFCGGRIDEPDGSASLILGPSDIQEELSPCVSIGMQGRCLSPLGPTTVGLIYVNPEGPVGAEGDTVASGVDIRNAFLRMGFSDTESVALIGGGHAFGKAHGACTAEEAPCGAGELQGKGPNTLTSGFEGAWTEIPTTWSNLYFKTMFDLEWELGESPAGNIQFHPAGNESDIMMLVSDLALRDDPIYRPISLQYKDDIASLEHDFMHAWYRLTTADMGPVARCLGDMVPPAQPFQYPLPEPSGAEVDYVAMHDDIVTMIEEDKASHIPAFTNLAYQCASTFRQSDYQGGCNGARIRFEPQLSWPGNEGVSATLDNLKPIQDKYPDASMADIIVLAGKVAVEMAGGETMAFCGGRVDAMEGDGAAAFLAPRTYSPALLTVRDWIQVSGLSPDEGVALFARPTSESFSNQYFLDLQAGNGEYSDLEKALLEPEFLPIVEMYAGDNEKFMGMFSQAWTKMMTADRFDGPANNACEGVDDLVVDGPSTTDGSTTTNGSAPSNASIAKLSFGFAAFAVVISSILL